MKEIKFPPNEAYINRIHEKTVESIMNLYLRKNHEYKNGQDFSKREIMYAWELTFQHDFLKN